MTYYSHSISENGIISFRYSHGDGTFHRFTIAPGNDYSRYDDNVKQICEDVHTPEVIQSYKDSVELEQEMWV